MILPDGNMDRGVTCGQSKVQVSAQSDAKHSNDRGVTCVQSKVQVSAQSDAKHSNDRGVTCVQSKVQVSAQSDAKHSNQAVANVKDQKRNQRSKDHLCLFNCPQRHLSLALDFLLSQQIQPPFSQKELRAAVLLPSRCAKALAAPAKSSRKHFQRCQMGRQTR